MPKKLKKLTVQTQIVAKDETFIPKYKSKGAACCDLLANLSDHPDRLSDGVVEYLNIVPCQTVVIDCGFSMALPEGYEAQVRARTSFANKGLIVSNGPGTIDEDYRGPVKVILTNTSKSTLIVKHGERFAQMALKPVWYFEWEQVSELDDTERGSGAFGSTGK